ncbi:outer membrane lipoprotein carrier protein LolA [Paraburkholderia sp. J94]|uniref:LolA family protein n=1 Tax=Paraburkholderia sp. J94 TaxID=2805441 RepID=UPI002AB0A989|nr:outer membrane lipoprotein carrier protein LolA [Paraburkholderia sp. J94]
MGTLIRGTAFAALIALQTACWPVQAATSASNASASASDADAALVSQIAARLAQTKGVRSHFTQTQTLAALKTPLVSTGSLLFFRDRGVIWQIDRPYKKTWVMSDSGMTVLDATGQRVANGGAQGARGAAEIAKMMRAMLGGDLSGLYTQFDVQARGTPARWQMRLVPRQPQIAQALRGIEMDGGEFLQGLRITLANGDVTQYAFSGSTPVSELAPADQKLFGTP